MNRLNNIVKHNTKYQTRNDFLSLKLKSVHFTIQKQMKNDPFF